MNRVLRLLLLASALQQLAACAGAHDDLIAMCVAEAQSRLDGQVYRLQTDGIAQSIAEQADGRVTMLGEVALSPGTPKESHQTFACEIIPGEKDTPARVVHFHFNW